MAPSEPLDHLISLVYEAASARSGWQRFASELARVLSAQRCAAIVDAFGSGNELVLWAHGEPPHRSGRWRPEGDGKAGLQRPETVSDAEGHFLVGTLCRRDDAAHRLVAVRAPESAAFTDADVSLFAEILPHLARALRLYRTVRSSEDMHGALVAILDRLPEAIFLVDHHGGVLSCNGSARAILRRNDGFSVVDGRIALASADEHSALRALIAEAGAERPGTDAARGIEATMSVSRPSGQRSLPVVVTPLLCRGESDCRPAAVAAVITKDVDQDASVLAPNLGTAFNLTPGESRLAGLIADGLGIQAAAEALGITRNTARTHMKRIYAKTGVHSHADLVRLLSRGSIELRRPDCND